MQDITQYFNPAYGITSLDAMENLLYAVNGTLREGAEVQLLDELLQPLPLHSAPNPSDPTDISGFVISLSIENNDAQDVHRKCDLKLKEDPRIAQINYLRHFFRTYHCVYGPSGDRIMKVPTGIFGFQIPQRELTPGGNYINVTGYDLLWRLARLVFKNPYVVPMGTPVTTAVKTMLMADKLPPESGGRQPSGQSLVPQSSGGSNSYTTGSAAGVLVTTLNLGTDTDGNLVSSQQIFNPLAGIKVASASNLTPIDPWTNGPMVATTDPNFWQTSQANIYLFTWGGYFVNSSDPTVGYLVYDVFKNVVLTTNDYQHMSAGQQVGSWACPLVSWPYDYDGSGPYFVNAAGSGGGYCAPGNSVRDPASGCLPVPGQPSYYYHPLALPFPAEPQDNYPTYDPSTGSGHQYYADFAGLKVDEATGAPIDPNTCGPMAHKAFADGNQYYYTTTPSGDAVQWLGLFYLNFAPTLGGGFTGQSVDPKTGAPYSTASGSGFPLLDYGGDGYLTTSATTPTQTGTNIPWPDTNNPGLTPSGCSFYGPDVPSYRINVPDSDLVTPGAIVLDRGANVLTSINALLRSILYRDLWVDETGTFRSGPLPYQYTDAQGNAYIPTGWDWKIDTASKSSLQSPVVVNLADQSSLYNVITVKVEDPARDVIVVTRENRSPQSAISIDNLGYVMLKVIEDNTIGDAALATLRAMVELEWAATADEVIEVTLTMIPFFQTGDRVALNIWSPDGTTLEVDSTTKPYPFDVVQWQFDYANHEMKLQLHRVIGI